MIKWTEETPDDFRFFIKIPKTVSHEKRMKGCKEEISDFCNHIQSHLKEKLSGFLYQFPPSFKYTPENVETILQNIDFNYLNVIEFRHDSWWNEQVFNLLKENNIVVSGVSFPGNLPEDVIINHPDILYYRLHGKPVLYKSEYSEDFLNDLAKKIKKSSHTAFIFFNNTWGTSAVKNGLFLKNIFKIN